MKKHSLFFIVLILSLLMSCATPSFITDFAPTLTYTPVTPTATSTIEPTSTPKPEETEAPSSTPEYPKGVNLPKLADIMVNFTLSYCDALWANDQKDLACPSDPTSMEGSISRLNSPTLHGDVTLSNRALLAIPGYKDKNTGIFGRYPAYKVENRNTYFLSAVTCLQSSCNADFSLSYYAEDNKLHEINTWKVSPGQPWVKIDQDLSSLYGQTVNFVLTVRNVNQTRVEALWVEPLIYLKN